MHSLIREIRSAVFATRTFELFSQNKDPLIQLRFLWCLLCYNHSPFFFLYSVFLPYIWISCFVPNSTVEKFQLKEISAGPAEAEKLIFLHKLYEHWLQIRYSWFVAVPLVEYLVKVVPAVPNRLSEPWANSWEVWSLKWQIIAAELQMTALRTACQKRFTFPVEAGFYQMACLSMRKV